MYAGKTADIPAQA